MAKWARKEGRERGACGGGGESGVKVAWCLPLICHKDGRHIMTENVEQIGLVQQEGEEETQRGDRWQSWPGANDTNA